MPEREIPEFARRGVPIDPANPQPEVRKNAEKAADWEYAGEASYLYRMAVVFKDRLLDPLHHLDRDRLPDPVIAFEDLRNKNTLAAFRLTRNPNGLENEIIMNTQHYKKGKGDNGEEILVWEYGRWAQLETLLHEQVHEWQQVYGQDPVKLGRIYHNREFVEKCEALGLHPKLGEGYHTKLAGGAFATLMKELGVTPPPDAAFKPEEADIDWFKWLSKYWGRERKGRSTLSKWSCGCQNVRVGTKEFHAQCTKCGNVFVSAAKPHQDIYQANPAGKEEDAPQKGEPHGDERNARNPSQH